VHRIDRTFSSQEEIDTGDLSRAGPAYEAIEDSAVEVLPAGSRCPKEAR